jgi:hypothetical protein
VTRITILLLVCFIVPLSATKTWHLLKAHAPPVLDGQLDDSCWTLSVPRVGFIQRDPEPGEPSTEEATIYATYTDRAIYVAFYCGDSEPGRIVTRLWRRDSAVWPDDNIDLWIDPTGSGLQLYYFSTNPSGVKYDALNLARGRDSNVQWDAHWDVATMIHEDGWNAEFEIPFANLKFDFAEGRPWLFNAGRVIRRKGEETYTTAVPYEHNMFFIEDAVQLTGIDGIAAGVGVRIVPYGKADHRWFPTLAADDDTDLQADVGVDIDIDVGSNVTLATAFFPDFAEIDLDPDQYQIGFGQVFLPETRPFFLRDSNYFQTTNFRPFYSRRIGKRLFDENGVYHDADIVAGARLTGKIGRSGIGAFYAHTSEALWEPESDWGIARVTYELGPQSFIGTVGTFRDAKAVSYGDADEPSYQFASFGADYEYYFSEDWNTWGMLVGTNDSRYEENSLEEQHGLNAGMAWRRGTFEAWGNYEGYAERFSTDETGFVPWTDLHTIENGASYRFGFGNARFRNLGIDISTQQHRARDWGRGFEQYELSLHSQTDFNWMFNVNGATGSDELFFSPGEEEPFSFIGGGFSSDPATRLGVGTDFFIGSLPDYTTGSRGKLLHDELEFQYSPIPELQFAGELEFNRWWMDKGEPADDYDVSIWQATAEYLTTRELFFRVFSQGSSQNDIYTFRALIGWEYRPDSNIYLAYEQWRDDSHGDFELVNQGIFLKVDHYFQL